MNPSFDANGEFLYFLSYRDFTTRMDIFEDNHVIRNPVQVMAVQLRAGSAAVREGRGRQKAERAAVPDRPRRHRGPRVPAARSSRATTSSSRPARASSRGPRPTSSARASTRRCSLRRARTSGRCTCSTWARRSSPSPRRHVSDWKLSLNREQMIAKKGNVYNVSAVDKVAGSKALGTKLNLDQMTYRVEPGRRSGRRSSTTPGAGIATSSTTPNMHGHDWKKIGDKFRALLPELNTRAGPELAAVADGRRAVRFAHLHLRRRHQLPRSCRRTRCCTGLLGADLTADPSGYPKLARILGPTPYNRDLVGAARAPGRRREGR